MVEVFHYPNATVTAVWPWDTPKEREEWLERFKDAMSDFIIAAEKDIKEAEKAKNFTPKSSKKSNYKEDTWKNAN